MMCLKEITMAFHQRVVDIKNIKERQRQRHFDGHRDE